MKRIIMWLEAKFSRPRIPIAADDPVRVGPHDPEKDVLMPNIYADQHVATEPDLKILDLSSPDIDKSTGFNPYDTAVLRK